MTPAEFRILRESLGLSLREVGALVSPPVNWRSVARWEENRSPPADAVATLRALDRQVEELVARAVEQVRALASEAGPPEGIVLLRYATDEDLAQADPATLRALKSSNVHAAMIARAWRAIEAAGAPCRIVTFDAAAYDAWRGGAGLANDAAARSAWAAQALAQWEAGRG